MNTNMGNIISQKLIDVSVQDFEDNNGFFFRCQTAGNIKHCALNDADDLAVIDAFDASPKFDNPEICRKIFKTGTTAELIYVGYGV
jgi:hypothetical protein